MTHDLLVVVPGITGSALRQGHRTIWDTSAAAVGHGLAHTTRVLEAMRLPEGLGDAEPDPDHRLEPAGLIKGWHVWPGFWAGAGYAGLIERFRRLHPDQRRLVPFAYDWRLSNRTTAHRLQTTVETELTRWRERPDHAEAKVIYVCHSMGGLIARYYLEVLGGRETARRLITIGTPYSGSIKAIRALTGGLVHLVPRLNDQLVEVARTLPAVHQLLPTYRCVNTPGDPITLLAADLPDLPTFATRDAHRLQGEIAEAIKRNGPPPYERYAFGGRRQPTDQSVSNTPGGLRFHREQRGINHTGDGTVPLFSSVAVEDATTAVGVFHATRHSGLQRHELLLDQAIDKINGVDLGATLAPPYELALDLPEVAPAHTSISVRVDADPSDLRLQARIEDPDGAVLDAHIPVRPDGHGAYTTTLELPPGTWHLQVATVPPTPPAQVGEVIVVTEPDRLRRLERQAEWINGAPSKGLVEIDAHRDLEGHDHTKYVALVRRSIQRRLHAELTAHLGVMGIGIRLELTHREARLAHVADR